MGPAPSPIEFVAAHRDRLELAEGKTGQGGWLDHMFRSPQAARIAAERTGGEVWAATTDRGKTLVFKGQPAGLPIMGYFVVRGPGVEKKPFAERVGGMKQFVDVYALVDAFPPRVDRDTKGRLQTEHATYILSTTVVTFSRWVKVESRSFMSPPDPLLTWTSGDSLEPFAQDQPPPGQTIWWGQTQFDSRTPQTFRTEFEAEAFAKSFNSKARRKAQEIEEGRQ